MTLTLIAEPRSITGRKVNQLRQAGLIPAILYGHERENTQLSIKKLHFQKIYETAGSSSLIDLSINDSVTPALIHDVQLDPVTDQVIHADLFAVSMKEKLRTEIPLTFTGTSEAVDLLEGTLVTNKDHLTVECLPADLIPEITVDLTLLKTFDDTIHVKDLAIPATIEVQDDADEVVAVVNPPKSAEELEAELAEPVAESVEEIELSEERGKEEEVVDGETKTGEDTASAPPADEAAKKDDK